MPAKFDLKKAANGQFMFNLKAANGEIILTSEMYKAKDSAQNGIRSVKENAPKDERYERLDSKSGQPYFNLKAGNGEIIGSSQMYSSVSSRDAGIDAVKAAAPEATTEDNA